MIILLTADLVPSSPLVHAEKYAFDGWVREIELTWLSQTRRVRTYCQRVHSPVNTYVTEMRGPTQRLPVSAIDLSHRTPLARLDLYMAGESLIDSWILLHIWFVERHHVCLMRNKGTHVSECTDSAFTAPSTCPR